MSKSKLTDDQWATFFAREAKGETRKALAAEHGVSTTTVTVHARRLDMKKSQTGAPDHRRRPAGGWPADHRCHQSLPHMTTAVWNELLVRFQNGESAIALSKAFGPTPVAINQRARQDRMRPCDRPNAAYCPRRRGSDRSDFLPDPIATVLRLRTAQRPPAALPDGSDWATWLFLGGRGAGKTLAGASWLADQAQALGANGRLALIGPTLHDVREVMIEGVSGIRSLPRWSADTRPVFESSRRRLIFHGGCIAYAFSAEDPDSLRGPQFSAAWADEFCAWPGTGARSAAETLALLRMGLRLPGIDGSPPRLVVTTTPRPTRALISLRDESTCVLTHAGTAENAPNLAPGFLKGLLTLYGGTRREAQELDGKIVDLDGALFTAEMMALARSREDVGSSRPKADGPLERIIIAIDPTTTATGDACGIVVAASRRRPDDVREAIVLADRSMAGLSPDGWARRAVQAARDFDATAIVAEVNQGGEMVAQVLRTAGCMLKVVEVRATKGKRVRAEPVAALYEQGRVHHLPADGRPLDRLEEELMAFGTEAEGSGSLDRADALVWAITHLLIDAKDGDRGPRYRVLNW